MKVKTYYVQLKPIVTKFVENYLTDFTVHDKKVFKENKECSFVYAIRKSGTDICVLDSLDTQDQIDGTRIWLTTYNERFFHLTEGECREITKEALIEILDKRKGMLIPLNETRKIIKTVNYCDIRPQSDSVCYYKNQAYATRENLQYMPRKVRLC